MLRAKKADSNLKYIVSVIYKGNPTHHSLEREDDSAEFKINKQSTGCTTLEDAVQFLSSKQKASKWPLALTNHVSSSGGGDGSEGGADASAAAAEPQAEPRAEPAAAGGGPSFFHGPIKKGAADELLLADGGDGVNGKYLVRSKPSAPDTDFILSCIYKGNPTHHALVRPAVDEEFTINKQPTGCYTLEDCVVYLAEKRPKWPVKLTDFVPNGDAPAAAAPAQSAAQEPAYAVEPDVEAPSSGPADYGPMTQWFHGSIKKAAADGALPVPQWRICVCRPNISARHCFAACVHLFVLSC